MEGADSLGRVLRPRFDRRLQTHLSAVDLTTISRIPTERLERTALPNIGLVELVSGEAFDQAYADLYVANFHSGERERPDLIVTRLCDDFEGKRAGLAPYRIIGLRDSSGCAIGAAQFSVLFLEDHRHAVPYLQYIYVRAENRRQDLSELMHTLVLAVTTADAQARPVLGKTPQVPFTLMETEPPVHGTDEKKRANAAMRTQIHTQSGSRALMLQRPDGSVLTAHVQPGLEVGEPPLTYVWALRANPATSNVLEVDDVVGRMLIAGFYQSLRDEGFPLENISLAERLVEGRYGGGAGFCLLELNSITREMYVDIDSVNLQERKAEFS